MKGVLLAGGTGSRLGPLTKVINKHLLAVGSKPMIYYPLEQFKNCGIEEVLVVTGAEHAGTIIQQLGSGIQWNLNLTYKIQEEAGGIAQALMLAEQFASGCSIMVQLGDNIFGESLRSYYNMYKAMPVDTAMVLLKEVLDPERFGVASVEGSEVLRIVEKPENPDSNLAVTGCYFYPSDVFEYLKKLSPSDRGEYEISDLNQIYIDEHKLAALRLSSWWTDAGTPESLKRAQDFVMTL